MSASKAVSALKTKSPVKATKKGNLTTITAKVDNKAMKITTNAGNVPITVENNTIAIVQVCHHSDINST